QVSADKVMSYWQYIIQIPEIKTATERAMLAAVLSGKGIPTANAYYPACHEQPAFRRYTQSDYPIADKILKQHLALPMYVEMTLSDVELVADTINKILA